MTPLYAGLMCTLLLIGTVAGLFGCMSAVRCHRPFVFAITGTDGLPLFVGIVRQPQA